MLGRQRVSYRWPPVEASFLAASEGGNFDGIAAGVRLDWARSYCRCRRFVADLIGNMISFKNRVQFQEPHHERINAGVSAVAFGLLVYFLYGTVMLTSWGFAVMHSAP